MTTDVTVTVRMTSVDWIMCQWALDWMLDNDIFPDADAADARVALAKVTLFAEEDTDG